MDLSPRSATVPVTAAGAAIPGMPVWLSGAEGGEATVELQPAPSWAAVDATFVVRADVETARLTFDLDRLGVARSADLAGRLTLWSCPDPACREGERVDLNLDSGRATAELEPDLLEDRQLVFGATASSETGSFAATPLSLVDHYQVGLSSGAAETSYEFEIPPAGAGPAPEIGLTYSSTAVDSMAAARNNQPGVVGAGWQFEPGYITRHTSPCGFDFLPDDAGDRCIYTEQYSITLGGTSSRLFPVAGSGSEFRLEDDPNWRVHRRIRDGVPADAPDSGGVYWELIQPDGTIYSFGGRAFDTDANSIFYQWVLGPEQTRADYCPDDADLDLCRSAWRWQVDRVRDTNGNHVDYQYELEFNHYQARGGSDTRRQYVRAGRLTEVRYNFDDGDTHHSRVQFSYDRRCIPDPGTPGICDEEPRDDANQDAYPDTPLDLLCGATSTPEDAPPDSIGPASCDPDDKAQTFFTTYRLRGVTSSIRESAAVEWVPATEYQLTYAFSAQNTVDGVANPNSLPVRDGEQKLVLRTIQRVGQPTEPTSDLERIAGDNRVATAVAVSQAGWDDGSADVALIATGDNFPDAVAAGALAAAQDAPILLVQGPNLPDIVADEIDRLVVEEVLILGGVGAVSNRIAGALDQLGVSNRRVAGPDRFATAAAIALEAGAPGGRVAVAFGDNFPDALAAGSLAATDDQIPVLLTGTDDLPEATADALSQFGDVDEVLVLGGTAVISDATAQAISEAADAPARRIAGNGRQQTATAIAEEALATDGGQKRILAATEADFPDALSAGGLAGQRDGIVLLTPTQGCGPTFEWVSSNTSSVGGAAVVGGTAVVSEQTAAALAQAVDGLACTPATAGAALAPVTYDYTLLRNRISDGGASVLPLPRLTRITTELGGQVEFTYGLPRPCQDTAGQNAVHLPRHCFSAFVSQEEGEGPGSFALHNRYVVTEQRQLDREEDETPEVTTFTYGEPMHAYSLDPAQQDYNGYSQAAQLDFGCPCRQWNDWRGHAWTEVTTAHSVTRHVFHRGLQGDVVVGDRQSETATEYLLPWRDAPAVTLTDGSTVEDPRWLRGRTAEVAIREPGAAGPWRQREVTSYVVQETDASSPVSKAIPQRSRFVAPSSVTTTTIQSPGGEEVSRSVTTSSTYDEWGNLTSSAVDDGDDVRLTRTWFAPASDRITDRPVAVQITDGEGDVARRTTMGHDGSEPPEFTGAAPAPTQAVSVGNATAMREYHTLEGFYETSTAYDDRGRPETVTDANGHSVTTRHDPIFGTPQSVTNEFGHLTRYTYDHRFGLVTRATDANGNATSTTLDDLGRAVAVRLPTEQAAAPTYRFGYDPTARPASVTTQRLTADGSYLVDTAYHDGFGRVIQTRSPSSTEGQATVAATSYDGAGAVFRESAAYDIPGSVTTYEPPAWSEVPAYTETTYDHFGEPGVVRRMAAGEQLWQRTIDRSGWTVTTRGPEGQVRLETANGHGEIVSVTEQGGQAGDATAAYAYDASGTLRQMTDAGGAVTTVTTNLLGWKTGLDDPSSGSWSYSYDSVGQVIREVDPNDHVVTFEYDALNRLVERRADSELVASWQYVETVGDRGRLQGTTALTPQGQIEVSYGYDPRNRIVDQRWTIPTVGTHEMSWTFDATDQVTSVTYPEVDGAAETVEYGYDRAGRVETVMGDRLYLAAASYDAQGRVASQELFGGIARRAEHDPGTLHLTGMSAVRDDEPLQDLAYALDSSERVTRITDAVNGGQSQCFAYSARDELVGAFTTGPDCTAGHDPAVGADPYDHIYATEPNGNLTDRGDRLLSYEDPVRPHAVTSTSDGIELSYDAAGNMTRRVDGDGEIRFTFDADNRLAEADGPGGVTSYLYDADGHRMAATGVDGTTAWLDQYVELRSGGDGELEMVSRYLSGDQLLAESNSATGETTTMLPDHLGSTVVAVPEGRAPQFVRYDPWGARRESSAEEDVVSRGFTSAPTDPDTGLVWLSIRNYDPALGRFVQPDTIVGDPGSPGGINRYAYMSNNPQGGVDPSGHFGALGALVGGVVGAVANYGSQVATNVAENGFSTEAFTDIDLGAVGRATAVGMVAGATGGVGATAFGGGTLGLLAGGGVSGAVSGQASRAAENALSGRPITEGLLAPGDLLMDAGIGVVSVGAAAGFTRGRSITRPASIEDLPTGAPTTPQSSMYRTVSDSELADIQSFGGFRPNPVGNSYDDLKLFAENADDAVWWGQHFARWEGEPYWVLQVDVPEDLMSQFGRRILDSRPVITVPATSQQALNRASRIHIHSQIPI